MTYTSIQPTDDQRILGIPIPTQRQWLERIRESKYIEKLGDCYNQGELVTLLEQRVATLLNKPACLYFNKGMQAQFAMLKVSESRKNNANILMHPLCHIAWDEADAFRHLLNLKGIIVGNPKSALGLDDFIHHQEDVATLLLELPLRRAGFKLPTWEEIVAMQAWANERQVHFHLDGARLWECTTHYQKSPAEIAACFNTVYVSFYKGLGALGGAVLAGEKAFIDACRLWRTRLAGDAFSSFPQLVTALDGLDQRLSEIPTYVKRARSIAMCLDKMSLDGLPDIRVEQPKTNGFFVFLKGDKERLNNKAQHLNMKKGLKLFSAVNQFPLTEELYVELQVGYDHKLISNDEIIDYFEEWLA